MIVYFLFIFLVSVPLNAEVALESTVKVNEAAPSVMPSPSPDDGWTEEAKFTEAEKKANCKKYEGKYLSYYDMVYLVDKCALREVQSHEAILKLNREHVKFHVVTGDVLAMLDKGAPVRNLTGKVRKPRTCKELDSKYVTYSYTNVYYLSNCKRRPFPDWASFLEHRRKTGRIKEEVKALTYDEFSSFPEGRSMDSIVDSEYRKQQILAHDVDIIPLSEACKGLNGRDVSYFDRIYRIENCRKRMYDAQAFFKKHKNSGTRLTELSSEQWFSIPDGKPMDKNVDTTF